MRAMRTMLEESLMQPNVINFLMELLEIVVTKNFFMFEEQFYLQLQGTVMGSNVAPSYANCFISRFESEYIYPNRLYQTHCLLWRRYIDDVFCLWQGTEDSLLQFLDHVNSVWPELKFTLNFNQYEINFLDTKVLQGDDGNLTLDLYTKDTDPVKRSVPISQFERVRRIVSNPQVCTQRLEEMKDKFQQRGYPPRLLHQAQQTRNTLPRSRTSRRLPFVHTFHPFMYRVHRKIRKHWHILQESFPDIPEFQEPFLPCFRRPKNLKNKIVRADIGSALTSPRQVFLCPQSKGTFPCLQCAQCANVLKGPSISHPQTGDDITFTGFFTCESLPVVYAIKCPCGMIYVGETTQAVKDLISHHKSDIRCKKNHLPVPYHFNTAGHSIAQLRFFVLEQVSMNRRGGDVTQKLLAREAYWIHFLQSMEPRGLNRDFDVSDEGYISVIKMHFGTNLLAGRFGGRTAHAPAILQDGGAQGEDGRTDTGRPDQRKFIYRKSNFQRKFGEASEFGFQVI
ncbi:unnamed protein product [Ranitomeya imitator]|uniref:Reverse transcriptase domain-containing protein n=1 Tax=Ranitomeya imitator TaxID=111125 RepID=A0ABN9M384_9NEOB|nr:unnamed protein product [Ranitomeya imitator]